MMLIPCPWCGPRNQIEFTYGGDAMLRRPAPDAPEAAWVDYVYLRDNPCGPHDELWYHGAGCRSWFKVRRNTRTHEIIASAPADQSLPDDPSPAPPPPGPDRSMGIGRDAAVETADRAARSIARVRSASNTTACATRATPATRSPLRFSRTACISSARSFKYHRPRGIYSAGAEEPNALVQLARGARTEPNTRATTLELYDGLIASSQNCWPSVRFDIGAVANALSPLLPAGFYYKTFMWPPTPTLVAPVRSTSSVERPAWDAQPARPIPIATSISTPIAMCW